MKLTDMGTLVPLLKKYGLYTQKRFGQHFLINEKVLTDMLEVAEVDENETVVEIGVGTGVLTRELGKRAGLVVAYEIDEVLRPLLVEETLAGMDRVDLRFGDFLKAEPGDYIPDDGDFKVVANLPYNVGSHIIDRLLKHPIQPRSITVLLQREVAEKFVSGVPDGTYLRNFVGGYGEATIVRRVKRGDFFPAPKVESAVLHLVRSDEAIVPAEKMRTWSGFLHRGFKQPRKKLNKAFSVEDLAAAEIDADLRPQHVELAAWLRLFDVVDGD